MGLGPGVSVGVLLGAEVVGLTVGVGVKVGVEVSVTVGVPFTSHSRISPISIIYKTFTGIVKNCEFSIPT